MMYDEFSNIFAARMMQRYYAMMVIKSGKVESKIDEKHAIWATLVSWGLDFIPKVGNKISDLLLSSFKKYTVDNVLKKAQYNLKNPTDEQFKLYAQIISFVADLNANYYGIRLSEKHAKPLAEKFLKFASHNHIDNVWQNTCNSKLGSKLIDYIEKGHLSYKKAQSIIFVADFIDSIKISANTVKSSYEQRTDITKDLVLKNLDNVLSINTDQEAIVNNKKEIDINREMIKNQGSAVCTLLADANVTSLALCMGQLGIAAA